MVVGNKRGNENKSQAMLFDIEGTTTSISFVKDTLFPYVRQNLKEFVERQWNETEFHGVLSLLKDQSKQDEANKVAGAVAIPEEGSDAELQEAVVNNVLWQMDGDLKNKALKKLQGHIMREGYKKGELKGQVYPDVVPALKTWVRNGCKLYVYSSGSVEAQKLLFGHSQEGDLLELFQGHFDTEIGPKTEARSFTNIMEQLEYQADDVVFFTDVPKEAIAAEEAGMTAVLVVREGNAPLTDDDRARFQVIETFEDFEREAPTKRRKVSVEENVEAAVEDTPNDVVESESEKASALTEDAPQDVKETPKTPEDIPLSEETKDTENVAEDVEMKDVSEATLPEIDEKGEDKKEEGIDSALVVEVEKPLTETAEIDSKNAELPVEEPEKMEEDKSEIKECKSDSEVNVTEVAEPVIETNDVKEAVEDKVNTVSETEAHSKAEEVVESLEKNTESIETSTESKVGDVKEIVDEVKENVDDAKENVDDVKENVDAEKVTENDSGKVEDMEKVSTEMAKVDEPAIENDEGKENNVPDEDKATGVEDCHAVAEAEADKVDESAEKGQGDAAVEAKKPADTVDNKADEKLDVDIIKSGIAGEGDNAETAITADG